MKFLADRKSITAAVKKTAKTTANAKDLPQLSGLLLEVLHDGTVKVTGTDLTSFMQIRLSCTYLEKPGKILVDGKLLGDILTSFSEEQVMFSLDGATLTLASGKPSFQIATMDDTLFPAVQIPLVKDMVSVYGLRNMISRTVFAVGEEKDDPKTAILQGVKIKASGENTKAIASNGMGMAIAELPSNANGTIEFVAPQKALGILSSVLSEKDDRVYVGVAGRQVVFLTESMVYCFSMIEGIYPDVEQILAKVSKDAYILLDSEKFTTCLRDATACLINDADQCINLKIYDNTVVLSAVSKYGNSRKSIRGSKSMQTPDSGYHYDPGFISDFLKKATGPLQVIITNAGVMQLKANASTGIIVPRRPVNIKTVPDRPKRKYKAKKTKKEKESAVETAA